jgi:DNA repair exonuclease SbcCD nuclease subunit
MRFLHTADWQIGKPFQSIADNAKREALRKQRVDTIRGLRSTVESESLDFVVVCGDLFDSFTPDKATVSALCSAIGELKVPVYAIPGNHDHGGPGCIWEQSFFKREQEQLAPNFHILLKPEPLVLKTAVLLPCPLLRRHESVDPTAWLRSEPEGLPEDLPRIILAHGSTQGFSSSGESDSESAVNRIQIEQLAQSAYDYIALGDWHGMKKISEKAWFSGTPEQDRFAKGDGNQPAYALTVEIKGRSQPVQVNPVQTGKIGWHALAPVQLNSDQDLDELELQLDTLLEKRTNSDLIKLDLTGALSFNGLEKFEALAESLAARLIRLNLDQNMQVEPSTEELDALSECQDPLIAQVARELRDSFSEDPLARDALRELQLELRKVEA